MCSGRFRNVPGSFWGRVGDVDDSFSKHFRAPLFKKHIYFKLETMCRTNDGFEIAEIDLRLRGPGQVLGTRQSGLPDLALASLADDAAVLDDARAAGKSILTDDPDLGQHPTLLQLLADQQRRLAGGTPLN